MTINPYFPDLASVSRGNPPYNSAVTTTISVPKTVKPSQLLTPRKHLLPLHYPGQRQVRRLVLSLEPPQSKVSRMADAKGRGRRASASQRGAEGLHLSRVFKTNDFRGTYPISREATFFVPRHRFKYQGSSDCEREKLRQTQTNQILPNVFV